MVRLIKSQYNFDITKEELVQLERQIVRLLDWELVFISPCFFLERFQRIFGVDREKSDSNDARVGNLARKMLRCMLLSSTYLHFKPSQVAAAALLLSMNINGSECAQLMGAPNVLHDLHEKSVFYAENNGQEERK